MSLPTPLLPWALGLALALLLVAFCVGITLGNYWIPEKRRWWYAMRDVLYGLSSSYRLLLEDVYSGMVSSQFHGHGNFTPMGASLLPLMALMVFLVFFGSKGWRLVFGPTVKQV